MPTTDGGDWSRPTKPVRKEEEEWMENFLTSKTFTVLVVAGVIAAMVFAAGIGTLAFMWLWQEVM